MPGELSRSCLGRGSPRTRRPCGHLEPDDQVDVLTLLADDWLHDFLNVLALGYVREALGPPLRLLRLFVLLFEEAAEGLVASIVVPCRGAGHSKRQLPRFPKVRDLAAQVSL